MSAEERRLEQTLSRRSFAGVTAAGLLSALAGSEPALAEGSAKIEPRADAVILLWMAGGMASTETFDPKRYTPFEPGIRSEKILSTFRSIPTAVDHIRISEGLENIARVMDRATLIRSYRAGDLGFILHSRHQFHWHTGYAPPQSVAVPHMGAVIARTLGSRNPDVPAFIDIGQNLEIGAESPAVKAFHTAGFLGAEYGPFLITNPEDAASAVRPLKELGERRFASRRELYRKLLDASPVFRDGSSYQRESLVRSLENAHRLLSSPAAKAFDLSLEPKQKYDIYNTSRFGLGCLLARRLVEAGARFIEVTTEYVPFRYWDTHENGHVRTRTMKQWIDRPVAQLILDLEERGLLDRTLVILATEFSRDMMTEGKPDKKVKDQVVVPDVITEMKHYGMHRHFTDAVTVVLFGGGFKKGFLYGRTADERPVVTVENPIGIEDLHATIYYALGIAPDTAYVVEKRPVYVTKDGKGKPRMELFA